jgi:hypothetical protein
MSVVQRTALIRLRTPDILKISLEEQRWLCDLCGHRIQDIILAALDHSIPVINFARGPLPIEQAVEVANAPSNLRAAHRAFNHAKS